MTAPLSVGRPGTSDAPPSSAGTSSLHLSQATVSVSPRTLAGEDRDLSRSMFITPRVIDQNSFDELASTLRGLIDEADQTRRALAAHITQADGSDARAAKAVVELQERLRLGARLINAFQSQIARIENAIAEIDRREQDVRRNARPADVVDPAFEAFRSRVERVIEQAMARLDAHVDDLAALSGHRIARLLHRIGAHVSSEAETHQSLTAAEVSSGGD